CTGTRPILLRLVHACADRGPFGSPSEARFKVDWRCCLQEAALKRLMAALLGAVPMILGTPVSRSATTSGRAIRRTQRRCSIRALGERVHTEEKVMTNIGISALEA